MFDLFYFKELIVYSYQFVKNVFFKKSDYLISNCFFKKVFPNKYIFLIKMSSSFTL